MYSIRAAFASIARNKLMAFVSLGVIVVSVFVLGVFLTITVNLQSVLSGLKEKVEIRAFLFDGTTDASVARIEKEILSIKGVRAASYTSKTEALNEFRDEYRDKARLLEAIETNPLPASFSVRLFPEYRTQEKVSVIARKIEAIKGVEEVEYGKKWVGKLDELVRVLVIIDATVGAIIALSCLFLVFNTIRLTVFTRREEIEIMSLVGATDSSIRRPFLLVGLFYGFVGGILAVIMLYAVHAAIAIEIPAIRFLDFSYLVGLVAFATLLGYFGSLFSVRRFVF
jgi:cell division transport system permease protein